MKLMRLAMCVAVFALVGGIAMSEDLDVRALQAKLAAQEARLNDLQAKMAYSNNVSSGSVADGVLSINKNAVVTVGGNLNVRYFGSNGKVSGSQVGALGLDGRLNPNNERYRYKNGDFKVADSTIHFKIDVNDYFDAWVKVELQDSGNTSADNAKQYWVRWKNICNSGFGVLVGRGDLVFGDGSYGVITGYIGGDNGRMDDVFGGFDVLGPHTGWDRARTLQVTPYWESQDGKIKAELSFVQGIDQFNSRSASGAGNTGGQWSGWDGTTRTWRSNNYGAGSMSARVVVNPIEGLKLSASVLNLYNNNTNVVGSGGYQWWDPNLGAMTDVSSDAISSSNQAIDLAFQYRPCFFNRLNIWTQWIHGWDEGFIKDRDSDTVNFGASFDITDQITFFAQGDYIKIKNDGAFLLNGYEKATGWAFYTGLQYRLPYGVDLEVGYRHDKINYKGGVDNGKWAKFKADTIYGHLGFNF